MKKRILSLLVATSLVFGITGCGSSEEATGDTSDNSTENTATDEGWSPDSTVSIVVPAGAGGNTDLSARLFAQCAHELTGVDFIVVNSNGAAGSIAANQVLAAKPDGLTMLYGHTLVNVANIAGVTDYNYTAFKLGPTFALDPAQQLYVNPEKYASLDDFIEAAKAAPGELKACTEVGAYTYYELLAFEQAAGIDLDLVDVGSNSDKIAALLSGQVDLMPGSYINTKDYIEAGEFMALGAPTEERYDIISDIPTFKEQGIDLVYPNCEFSLYFPKDTPDEIIQWYDDLVKEITTDPETQQAIRDLQMEPYYLSPEDSEVNEENMYNDIKAIADSLE